MNEQLFIFLNFWYTMLYANDFFSSFLGGMKTVWLKWRPVVAGVIVLSIVALVYYSHARKSSDISWFLLELPVFILEHEWNLCGLEYQADASMQPAKVYCNFPVNGASHGAEGLYEGILILVFINHILQVKWAHRKMGPHWGCSLFTLSYVMAIAIISMGYPTTITQSWPVALVIVCAWLSLC